jgi:hypothetical protein
MAVMAWGISIGIRNVSLESLTSKGLSTATVLFGLAIVIGVNAAVVYGLFMGKKWAPLLLLVLGVFSIAESVIGRTDPVVLALLLGIGLFILVMLFTKPSRKFFFHP